MPKHSLALDELFTALADPTRRAVLERLVAGPCSVSDLAGPFKMAMSSFLQHLNVLARGGLIRTKKIGRVRTVEMNPAKLRVAESWLVARREQWESRLDRLDQFLLKQKGK
jgi:DNA-binding transcriptional ArsR family regulator